MNRNRYILQHCIEKIERLLFYILTVGWVWNPEYKDFYGSGKHHMGRSFWCDSHPQLCKCCHAFRIYMKIGCIPPCLYIATKKGTFECRMRKPQ